MATAPALELLGDGSNGSITILDTSTNALSVTPTACTLSTTQVKNGTASIRVPGTLGARLDITPTTAMTFGTGDFTVEADLWGVDAVQDGVVWICGAYGTATGCYGEISVTASTAQLVFNVMNPNATAVTSYTTTRAALLGAWHHVGWVRKNGIAYILLDDRVVASAAMAHNFGTPVRFRVGSMNHYAGVDNFTVNYSFNGYIDSFRATAGSSVWLDGLMGAAAATPGQPLAGLATLASGAPVPDYRNKIHQSLFSRVPSLATITAYGPGFIAGTVKVLALPSARVVCLYDRSTRALLRQTVSAADGSYRFDNLMTGHDYFAVVFDDATLPSMYNAAVADMVQAGLA